MKPIATMAQLAEDAGHMGYSADYYPGCPAQRKKEKEERDARLKQIELEFDLASKDY